MRFSARETKGCGGRRNAHPRPSYRSLRRAQPMSFLQPASNCYVVDRSMMVFLAILTVGFI
jgi:hypothetical protein